MTPFKQNVINRLLALAEYEEVRMKKNEKRRNAKDSWESLTPREVFDCIQHDHKENIRALRYAINLVKRSEQERMRGNKC